jgi:hypothetical protein
MAECDGSSVDVESLLIDRKLAEAREYLCGECFVQLDQVDLIQRQTGDLECFPDRRHWTDSESFRLYAGGGKRDEAAKRRQALLASTVSGRHNDGRRSVAHLGRITRGDRPLHVKGRAKLCEGRLRRLTPWPLVDGELLLGCPRCPAVRSFQKSRRDRDDLVGESAGVYRGHGTLMATQREGVLFIAGDDEFASVVLGD